MESCGETAGLGEDITRGPEAELASSCSAGACSCDWACVPAGGVDERLGVPLATIASSFELLELVRETCDPGEGGVLPFSLVGRERGPLSLRWPFVVAAELELDAEAEDCAYGRGPLDPDVPRGPRTGL